MTPQEQISAVYAKLHENRFEQVEQARRARDVQANLCKYKEALDMAIDMKATQIALEMFREIAK